MKTGDAGVTIQAYPDTPVTPYVSGGYAWLEIGGVKIHCHTAEIADRLAEGARDLAAGMRIDTMPKVERPT